MNVLIGLIPAVGWGFQPILSQKTGAKPANQLVGTVLACFIIGCFIFVSLVLALEGQNINYFVPIAFWCNFIKGILWCCGAVCIFTAFKYLGVGSTGPISTGVQLVYTTIMGIAMFQENYNHDVPYQGILICIACLLVAMIGMCFVSWHPKSKNKAKTISTQKKKPILLLCILFLIIALGNGSFFVFSNIPLHYYSGHFESDWMANGLYTKMFHLGDLVDSSKKNFYDSVYNLSAMFSLGIGMMVGGIIVGSALWLFPLFNPKQKSSWNVVKKECPFTDSKTYLSIPAGISFSIASLGLLYSTQHNNSSIASLLGQFNVVILSLFGLLIFHEKKTKAEYISLFIGLGLVTLGCIIPAFITQFYPSLA